MLSAALGVETRFPERNGDLIAEARSYDSARFASRADARSFDCLAALTATLYADFLSRQQQQDFRECFSMLDASKTGRLNVDDLLAAFHLLGIEVSLLT